MLEENFFTISAIQQEATFTKVMVEIDPAHTIFEGHFPKQPIVPGACLLQILKEVLQNITGQRLQLQKANQLKFISLVDPSKNHALQFIVTHSVPDNGKISVSATVLFDTTVSFKFNGVFQFV
jgi:3-hydroxyacyl-[acyl-carrier-protein] dehydratase